MCLFQFWFPQCVCPAEGLLGHKEVLYAIIWLVQHLIQRSKIKKIEERTVKKECKSEGQFAYEQRKLNKQIDRKYNKKKKKK